MALQAAAFPQGISFVDAYIPDENRLCHDAITALRSPAHAAAVLAIKLPAEWTTQERGLTAAQRALMKSGQLKFRIFNAKPR